MSSVSNILNSNPFSKASVNRFKDYEDAAKCTQSDDRSRYNTLSELQDSGLLGRYDTITRDLIRNESYKIPVSIAKEKLGQEELLIKDVREALHECTTNIDEQAQVLGTREERANKALKEIQQILNRKDSNGRYILGVINSSKQPCGDLVASSNIVDGVPSANYTEATSNRQEIAISDGTKVTFGLCASEPAFRQVIATINKIKSGTNVEAETLKQEAVKSLALLELNNGENLTKANEAKDYNDKSDIRLHKELEDSFSISRVQATQNLNCAMQALMESMTLMTKQHKLDDAFNQVF
jgi:hypothetical protein